MVSGVEFSDSSLNIQYPVLITSALLNAPHPLTHPSSTSLQAALNLFSVFKSLLRFASLCFYLILFFLLFFSMYLFWEKAGAGERQRERERERIPSRPHTANTEPNVGLKPMKCNIMTWAETKSWALNWMSHPGTPHLFCFLNSACEWNYMAFIFLWLTYFT